MRHLRRRRTAPAVLAASALLLGFGACSSDDDGGAVTTAGGSDAPAGDGATITIQDFAYSAATVESGGSVAVTNADSSPHTITSTDDAFEELELGGDEAGELVAPDEPGEYEYFCNIHGAARMTGTLVVE